MIKRISPLLQATLLAAALVVVCVSANAQAPIPASVTVDENGHFTPSSGGIINNAFVDINHFDGSGLYLTYTFADLTPGIVPLTGAVYIWDNVAHTLLSDVIVFQQNSPSYLYFLSFDSNSDKADVGSGAAVPSWVSNLPVKVDLTEGPGGVTVYTPTAQQPGFTDSYTVTYSFDSFEPATGVPDGGSTVCLLGMALVGLGSLRKWLARA